MRQIKEIVDTEALVAARGLPDTPEAMRHVKAMGFSDARLGELTGTDEDTVRAHGTSWTYAPISAALTPAPPNLRQHPYLYSSYDAPSPFAQQAESEPTARPKAVILGGGPNRIGQGIEFDYCCCHARLCLEDADVESIMVNCNPETVPPTMIPPIDCISSHDARRCSRIAGV